MSGPEYTVSGLLFALDAVGVALSLNTAGDGLTLTGTGQPPADLLAAVRAMKPELLSHLRGQDVHTPDTPSVKTGPPARPDWATTAAQPGRCGSCARAVDAPDWGALMVTCTCDPVAWWPLSPPLALHVGATCGAYQQEGEVVGRGWRSKDSGKAWGPMRPVPLEALPQDAGAGVA